MTGTHSEIHTIYTLSQSHAHIYIYIYHNLVSVFLLFVCLHGFRAGSWINNRVILGRDDFTISHNLVVMYSSFYGEGINKFSPFILVWLLIYYYSGIFYAVTSRKDPFIVDFLTMCL